MFLLRLSMLFFLISVLSVSCSDEPSTIEQYFENAEVQAENDEQRKLILWVLSDLSGINGAFVRGLRYPDYEGNPEAWSAYDVIKKHIVPEKSVNLSEDVFYKEFLTKKNVKAITRFAILYRAKLAHEG